MMYSFEYNFFPDSAFWGDASEGFYGSFYSYIGGLRRNGQILGELDNIVQKPKRIQLRCVTPEKESLDGSHHSVFSRDDLAKIDLMSLRPPQLRLVGKVFDLPMCCSCSKPSWYALFTHFLSISPPVDCGDCGLPVPSYRLPLLDEEKDHSGLLHWQTTYQCFDTLFMFSGAGERSGLRQMAAADSDLSVKGRKICEELAAKTGRPFYYFLMQYYPQKETCPGCGGDWRLKEQLPGNELYTFKCDRCFLLSNEPSCTD